MIGGALREVSDGILIAIDVRPDAAATRVTGYNEWRRAVTVDIAAPPERGSANRELEALLARIAGRSASARVVRGHTDRRKTVLVSGVAASALAEAIEGELR